MRNRIAKINSEDEAKAFEIKPERMRKTERQQEFDWKNNKFLKREENDVNLWCFWSKKGITRIFGESKKYLAIEKQKEKLEKYS